MPNAKYVSSYPYLEKLVAEMGAAGAAKALDLSDSTVSGAIRENKVRLVWELAAESVWIKRHPTRKGHSIFILRVPGEHRDVVKHVLEGLAKMGVQSRNFEE